MTVTSAKPAAERLDPALVRTALVLIVGVMAVVFDTTIVSVALHTLAVKLDTSVATIQWVTTGYLLALGIAVPLSTWGLQRFGGKRLWMFSLAVFLAGSIGSSLAWDVGSLIGWRAVQGIGGGLMLPLMTTLIFQAAGGKSLGRLVTYVALPVLLGPVLGPLLGGAILTHLSWRFMFWVNVPFCVIGILLAWRYLDSEAPTRSDTTEGKPRLDVPGLFLLAPGTSLILLGLANAGTAAGFAHPDVVIPLAVGAALLAAFTGYALRKSRPLVEVRLLARRPVASSSAVLFFSGFSLYGAMLLMPLYYQDVRGTTALAAGVMLVPQGIGSILSRTVAGSNIDRFGSRVIALCGFAVVAAATVPFALAGPHTSEWLLALWMVIRGFGLGAVTMPVMVAGYIGLDEQQIPHSSVLTRTAQQIGGSFGTAVLAVILEGAIAAHPATLADAFHVAFWWSVGFSALAVLLSLWLPGAQQAPEVSPAGADQPGQAHGAAVDQRDAPAPAEDAEHGGLVGDPQVAPQRQFQAAGHRVPRYRGDDRLGQPQPADPHRGVAVRGHPVAPFGADRGQVGAGAEDAALAVQHGNRGSRVGVERAEGRGEPGGGRGRAPAVTAFAELLEVQQLPAGHEQVAD